MNTYVNLFLSKPVLETCLYIDRTLAFTDERVYGEQQQLVVIRRGKRRRGYHRDATYDFNESPHTFSSLSFFFPFYFLPSTFLLDDYFSSSISLHELAYTLVPRRCAFSSKERETYFLQCRVRFQCRTRVPYAVAHFNGSRYRIQTSTVFRCILSLSHISLLVSLFLSFPRHSSR